MLGLSAAWGGTPARTTASERAARPSTIPPPTQGPGRRCGLAARWRRHLPSRRAVAPGGPLPDRAQPPPPRQTAARATTMSWTPHSPSGAAGQGTGKRGPARGAQRAKQCHSGTGLQQAKGPKEQGATAGAIASATKRWSRKLTQVSIDAGFRSRIS